MGHLSYVKLRVAHAPGIPGTLSPPPLVSDPGMHHGTCVTHVPWCIPGSLTSGFLWSRWRGKRSRHSRRMRNWQFCLSGQRPIAFCFQHVASFANIDFPRVWHICISPCHSVLQILCSHAVRSAVEVKAGIRNCTSNFMWVQLPMLCKLCVVWSLFSYLLVVQVPEIS